MRIGLPNRSPDNCEGLLNYKVLYNGQHKKNFRLRMNGDTVPMDSMRNVYFIEHQGM